MLLGFLEGDGEVADLADLDFPLPLFLPFPFPFDELLEELLERLPFFPPLPFPLASWLVLELLLVLFLLDGVSAWSWKRKFRSICFMVSCESLRRK